MCSWIVEVSGVPCSSSTVGAKPQSVSDMWRLLLMLKIPVHFMLKSWVPVGFAGR